MLLTHYYSAHYKVVMDFKENWKYLICQARLARVQVRCFFFFISSTSAQDFRLRYKYLHLNPTLMPRRPAGGKSWKQSASCYFTRPVLFCPRKFWLSWYCSQIMHTSNISRTSNETDLSSIQSYLQLCLRMHEDRTLCKPLHECVGIFYFCIHFLRRTCRFDVYVGERSLRHTPIHVFVSRGGRTDHQFISVASLPLLREGGIENRQESR